MKTPSVTCLDLKKNSSKEKYKGQTYMLVDYFSNQDFINIKIPNIQNFNIEPLEKYDEDMLYDSNPLT